jgi:hypothetical protein
MSEKKQAVQIDETAKVFGEFLKTLTVGELETHDNLTIFPVFTTTPQKNGYSLLDEAVKTGKFSVTEVTEGGSVPNLKVENGLDQDVLILDGDILIGAKQNRSVTTTIIIGRKSKSVIDVNCVERGRWHYKGSNFTASDKPMFSRARASKSRSVNYSLRENKSYAADQGKVWDDINEKSTRFSLEDENYKASGTEAANEMYASYEDRIKAYEGSFKPKVGQVGFVVLIDGKVAGCDIFGNPGVLNRAFGKGIRSYILDAIEKSSDKNKKSPVGDSRKKAAAFLAGVGKLKPEVFPSTGKGMNIRFEGKSSNGFAALDGDQVVHLAAFHE